MKRQRAFTLLEILVAFILMGVVGSLLLQLFQGGLRNIRVSAEHSHAALLARSKMTELLAVSDLKPGSSNGEFDGDYRWQLQLEPYAEAADEPLPPAGIGALQAQLRISWGDPAENNAFVVDTLYLSSEEAGG